MKVYRVQFAKKEPVGLVTEKNKVTQAHPSIGKVLGKPIKEVKVTVKQKKGSITRVR